MVDYSLLVGIHRLPALPQAQLDARLQQLRAGGGFVSTERQVITNDYQ